ISLQGFLIRRNSTQPLDLMKRRHYERSRLVSTSRFQLLHIERRSGKIKIASGRCQIDQLRAARFTLLLFMTAISGEEFGGSDVVISNNPTAAQLLYSCDSCVPASRVVINKNVIRTLKKLVYLIATVNSRMPQRVTFTKNTNVVTAALQ